MVAVPRRCRCRQLCRSWELSGRMTDGGAGWLACVVRRCGTSSLRGTDVPRDVGCSSARLRRRTGCGGAAHLARAGLSQLAIYDKKKCLEPLDREVLSHYLW